MRVNITENESVYLLITEGEYNFKEIIDILDHEIGKSEFEIEIHDIFITTYNLSLNNTELLDRLKKLQSRVKIITNIPGRFEKYNTELSKEEAKRKINAYTSVFQGESNIEHFFNMGLHGKMIITDKIGYIGSANFSDQSSKSIEIGIIIKDQLVLDEIKSKFLPFIEKNSKTIPITDLTQVWIKYYKSVLEELLFIETKFNESSKTWYQTPIEYSLFMELYELLWRMYEEQWSFSHELPGVKIPETSYEAKGYNPEYDCRCLLEDAKWNYENDEFENWAPKGISETLEYIKMIIEGINITINTLVEVDSQIKNIDNTNQ